MTRRKKCGRFGWLLIVLTIAALIMRILGCFWGLPLQLHPDEPATVDYAIEMLSRHSWMAQSFDRPDHFEIKCDAILFTLFSWLRYHQSAYTAFQSHAHILFGGENLYGVVWNCPCANDGPVYAGGAEKA